MLCGAGTSPPTRAPSAAITCKYTCLADESHRLRHSTWTLVIPCELHIMCECTSRTMHNAQLFHNAQSTMQPMLHNPMRLLIVWNCWNTVHRHLHYLSYTLRTLVELRVPNNFQILEPGEEATPFAALHISSPHHVAMGAATVSSSSRTRFLKKGNFC